MQTLGIDIGGSGIKGAPVDIEQGVLLAERCRIPTPKPATPQAVVQVVAAIAEHFAWRGPIGCTVPAVVQHGVVRTAANIHAEWIDTRFADLAGRATGLPVHVLNDADAAGLASVKFGAAKDQRNLVFFMTVGTGIGTAIFIDQTLVPNSELGHLTLHGMDAETYCSDRARKGEDLSWPDWAARFQQYLDLIESLLSPDLLIIGGGVSRPKKAKKFFDHLSCRAELRLETLENEAGIIGAACAAAALPS